MSSQQSPAPYRVLARKYRPRDFSGLIGQEPMVRTLKNAFEAGRIAQAWMLTGVRGVGKTSTARILARALNYETDTVKAPSIDLSVPGAHCEAIMEGRHVDVLEMDAASHTGIDDIKQIIDGVRYAPVSARYKVYIIDEVHMLSEKAFNALLKTLEEPPPHVKFIFATTEIRKVPVTILSRCQRFDLRRIDAGMLVTLLRDIAQKEGIEADDEALTAIARAGEGSARDALSLLDQAIAHGSGHVSAEAVQAMLGLADRSRLVELYAQLMAGDIVAALATFRGLYDFGADPAVILADLAAFNHLVTRLRFVPEAGDDAALPAAEIERAREFAEKLDVRHLSRSWQMLLKGIEETEAAPRPVDAAEMVLIRLAHASDLPTLDEVIRRADEAGAAQPSAPQPPSNGSGRSSGQGGSPGGAADAVSSQPVSASVAPQGGEPVASAGGAQTARLVKSDPQPAEAPPRPAPAPKVAVTSIHDIVRLAEEKRDLQFKVLIRQYVRPVSVEAGRLAIGLTDDAPKTLMNDLSRKLKEWTDINWVVTLDRDADASTLAEIEDAARQSAVADAGSDPDVAAALAAFPGAKIIDVRLRDAVEVDMAAGLDTDDIEAAPDPGVAGDEDD